MLPGTATPSTCNVKSHQALREKLEKCKKENADVHSSIDWMECLLNDDTDTMTLYDEHSRSYRSECQKCVYELLNHNVSVSKIGPVIECVVNMTRKHCDRVPTKGTVIDMNLQRLHLSQQHVGEVFAQEEDTCLLTDEMSKKGEKYMGYEASDSTGRLWVLGVRDMATKSAADTLSVFKEIVNDIDYTSEQSSDQTSKLILKQIVATMSDRAAT